MPSWLVVADGRVVAALVETVFVAAATYGIVSAFVPLHVDWTPTALLPAALIVVTGAGVSLIIAGATLVWKRVQMVNDTVMMLVFLFSAAAVPLITVPDWCSAVSRVMPLSSGGASLYQVMFLHESATSLWGTSGLVPLAATAAGYMAAGIAVFHLGEQTARRRGTLGRY